MSKLFDKRMDELAASGMNFDASPYEMETVLQITVRALRKWGPEVHPVLLGMQITACHLNGCPLKLRELLEADDSKFNHDVFGIRKHLDHSTGELRDCFLPRFACLRPVS